MTNLKTANLKTRVCTKHLGRAIYEGPPVNKSPGVKYTSPRGPPRGPEEGGEHYQHFEEIVGALRAQFFMSEFLHIGFQWILKIFRIGSLEIGVRARVRVAGVNKLRAKIGGNSLGEGGLINRRSHVREVDVNLRHLDLQFDTPPSRQ